MIRSEPLREQNFFVALSVAWLVFGAAGRADARQETLRWTHSSASSVQRFEALVGTSSGAYGSPVSLGKPTPDASGVFQGAITVGDTTNVYVVVRAIGTSGEVSPNSGESLRAAPAAPPPPPPDGGSTGGGSTGGGTTTTPTFNFEGIASGTSVPGWVDTQAAFSLSADDSLFGIASTGLGGSFWTPSTLSDIHSHMAAPAPATNRNYRLRGGMSMGSASSGIGITVYSGYPTRDAYYRLGRAPGETFKLSARHALTCTAVDTGYAPSAGGSYAYEIAIESLADRNRIQAKVWTLGGTEPASPQVYCDDTSSARPTSGTFGVWARGDGTKFWDNFVQQALTGALPTPPSASPTAPAPPVLIDIVPVN